MKIPDFGYARPQSLAEALEVLAGDEGAKIISGGQSLLPLMAYRLAAPTTLVDIQDLPDLDRIEVGPQGVTLGARVRWVDIERSTELARAHPLMVRAIDHVAHYQIRNRGTVGGSLAHADPAAEMPGLAVACDAEILLQSREGVRAVTASAFFEAPLTTCMEPHEMIVQVRFPYWPTERRWAFEEFARRKGDFAMSGVYLFYDADHEGRACDVHIGVIGVDDVPRRLDDAEAVVNGQIVDAELAVLAGSVAADAINPSEDIHASAEYRRSLTATLVERTLLRAAQMP